jgi:hypothetical protein
MEANNETDNMNDVERKRARLSTPEKLRVSEFPVSEFPVKENQIPKQENSFYQTSTYSYGDERPIHSAIPVDFNVVETNSTIPFSIKNIPATIASGPVSEPGIAPVKSGLHIIFFFFFKM